MNKSLQLGATIPKFITVSDKFYDFSTLLTLKYVTLPHSFNFFDLVTLKRHQIRGESLHETEKGEVNDGKKEKNEVY